MLRRCLRTAARSAARLAVQVRASSNCATCITMKHHEVRHFFSEYLTALWSTPQTFKRFAFRRRSLEEELQEVRGLLHAC